MTLQEKNLGFKLTKNVKHVYFKRQKKKKMVKSKNKSLKKLFPPTSLVGKRTVLGSTQKTLQCSGSLK